MSPEKNKELLDLQTHIMGATNIHETRTTDHIVQINPPLDPSHGPNDMRDDDRYGLQYNDEANEES